MTDKTGTLTQNVMELKGICIGNTIFGGRFVNADGMHQFESYQNTAHRYDNGDFHTVFDADLLGHMRCKYSALPTAIKPMKSLASEKDGETPLPSVLMCKGMRKMNDFNQRMREISLSDHELEINFNENPVIPTNLDITKSQINLQSWEYSINQRVSKLNSFLRCACLAHECIIDKDQEGKESYQSPSPDEIAICTKLKEIGAEFKGLADGIARFNFFGKESKVLQRFIFEFDSDRKRQSVIVREQDGDYVLYTKGADTSIIPFADPNLNTPEYLRDINKSLLSFSSLGYRTLVFARRIFTISEFEELEADYRSALTSTDRSLAMHELAKKYESNLEVLGATAVEDKLQDNVKETITRLIEADIKVWMITGDKRETAENIGMMSGIVTQKMAVFYLKEITKSNAFDKIREVDEKMSKMMKERKVSIIFDMRELGRTSLTLDFVFTNPVKYEPENTALANLLTKADSVVCARSTPKQKAKIVQFVKQKGKVTLAIGDGANDVTMIGEADIGVGLYGFEGRSAVRAADYAIANFRFLWKLILVEGRSNHLKITKFMLIFIYKNIMFTFPQVIYGFYSLFSAQSIHDDLYVIFYNLLFTALVVAYVGVLDRDINYLFALRKPRTEAIDQDESSFACKDIGTRSQVKSHFQHLYYVTQKRLLFSFKAFLLEVVNAIVQSTLITLIPIYSYGGIHVMNKSGLLPDFFLMGVISYTLILISHVICVLVRVGEINWAIIGFIALTCIFPFYVFSIAYDRWQSFNPYGSYSLEIMYTNPTFWMVFLASLGTVFGIEFCLRLYAYWFKPRLVEYAQEMIKLNKDENPDIWSIKNLQRLKNNI